MNRSTTMPPGLRAALLERIGACSTSGEALQLREMLARLAASGGDGAAELADLAEERLVALQRREVERRQLDGVN